jgi:hypothetical protein
MKIQSASPILWLGCLLMSDPTISTAIGPHTMTQQHATAQLSGPGWKRLVQSLNSSEATERFDPVTVQCVLDFFTLGSTCGEFQALSTSELRVLDNILIVVVHRSWY